MGSKRSSSITDNSHRGARNLLWVQQQKAPPWVWLTVVPRDHSHMHKDTEGLKTQHRSMWGKPPHPQQRATEAVGRIGGSPHTEFIGMLVPPLWGPRAASCATPRSNEL